ncbi:uncharacterized protein K489DRAFT_111574 [Dissoconium aciculare CBS 342.82]|uniref:Uncharacterized protein n=1 Tax=Dissoconium aciculare CBS 342.82 TaxID=1314786 RepID=A0A6J3MF54_9PEZI|nr:uncharacterized protein K489DRAFT_111574 [Dissoconium aciculare CBS 342.82]KAF1826284.1 hypothetical protein K489DRAFT_111574 [Dissoconium aciculare CBS 342.82]
MKAIPAPCTSRAGRARRLTYLLPRLAAAAKHVEKCIATIVVSSERMRPAGKPKDSPAWSQPRARGTPHDYRASVIRRSDPSNGEGEAPEVGFFLLVFIGAWKRVGLTVREGVLGICDPPTGLKILHHEHRTMSRDGQRSRVIVLHRYNMVQFNGRTRLESGVEDNLGKWQSSISVAFAILYHQ